MKKNWLIKKMIDREELTDVPPMPPLEGAEDKVRDGNR